MYLRAYTHTHWAHCADSAAAPWPVGPPGLGLSEAIQFNTAETLKAPKAPMDWMRPKARGQIRTDTEKDKHWKIRPNFTAPPAPDNVMYQRTTLMYHETNIMHQRQTTRQILCTKDKLLCTKGKRLCTTPIMYQPTNSLCARPGLYLFQSLCITSGEKAL